ncbi:MAG: shikimate dehydrogenase [Ruminococcus sp.]|nr:shikimate dehydrogenase [Ruminococcus sp.]
MSTKKYAVIGCPVGHSLSPFIHEKLFKLDNIDATYEALCIEDLDKDYETLKKLDGYNVTIPHKIGIINRLDVISKKAKLCESVNTVKNDELSYGYTTDGYGFLEAVKSKCDEKSLKNVLIYGYGGAARAIAFECIENGYSVAFATREKSLSNCNKLADEILFKLNVKPQVYTIGNIDMDKKFSLLVNATPVGMYPNVDDCVADDEVINNSYAVFDAVYNPLKTVLLKKAEEMGKIAISSIEMLVYQAAKAHEIWVNAKYNDSDLQKICRETEEKLKKG